jgi:hypothetical protein
MTGSRNQPRVFVSHATEDKARFVTAFAARLRASGIDAWVDQWEMLPGDSLVDKIFEEGLKDADAIIIVLSRFSVDKKWVREELNAAVVRKIENNCRLIPVRLDDCQVPECLRHTVWQPIHDLSSYDAEFERILDAIFGHSNKPPLGSPPPYVAAAVDIAPGLTRVDSLVLKVACETAIAGDQFTLLPEGLCQICAVHGLTTAQVMESLLILDGRGCLACEHDVNGTMYLCTVAPFGFENYARHCVPDYDEIVKGVAACLVNKRMFIDHAIAEDLEQPHLIVEHVLNEFERRGWIGQIKFYGHAQVYQIRPELPRWLAAR